MWQACHVGTPTGSCQGVHHGLVRAQIVGGASDVALVWGGTRVSLSGPHDHRGVSGIALGRPRVSRQCVHRGPVRARIVGMYPLNLPFLRSAHTRAFIAVQVARQRMGVCGCLRRMIVCGA